MKQRSTTKVVPIYVLACLMFVMASLLSDRSARAQTLPVAATTQAAVSAAAAASTQEDTTRHEVYVGVYINGFKSVDIKTNTFVVDFWLWFRWKGESIKPMESFEVVGGTIDSKNLESQKVVKGFNYGQVRVTATVTHYFDISRFPLDSHALHLDIEDSEREEGRLVFLPDLENCGLADGLQVPGWRIVAPSARVGGHTYATNYGDISLATGNKSIYSRFTYQVDLVRPGMGSYFKLFWSLFLATIIALLALLIEPIDLDPRFGLGVGAIFAAIASAYVISSNLPETNQYTLADKLNMLAVGVIFATILESVFSLRLWKSGKEAASKRLDRICFWAMLGGYVVGCAIISII